MITCRDCGAEIDENLPECPYCHAFLYPGAEAEYMGELEHIKEELGELAQVPQQEYKKEASYHLGRMGRLVALAALVLLAGTLLLTWWGRKEERKAGEQQWAQMIWEQENYPKLDAMFEAGDYDGILAFKNQLYEEEQPYHTWTWQHDDFIETYWFFRQMTDSQTRFLEREEPNAFELADLLYCGMHTLEEKEDGFTREEWSEITSWKTEVMEIYQDRFGFTRTEVETLQEELMEQGCVSFEKCEDYAKQLQKKIQMEETE